MSCYLSKGGCGKYNSWRSLIRLEPRTSEKDRGRFGLVKDEAAGSSQELEREKRVTSPSRN